MSYQEKRTSISLLSTILATAAYGVWLWQQYPDKSEYSESFFHFWGGAILIFIAVQVVFKLVFLIGFIIFTIREQDPEFTDEFDRVIEMKSTRRVYDIFMVGFVLAMIALVLKMPPDTMFIILLAFMTGGGIIGDVLQLYYYRRGV
ncbi:MAG TPA: hypothetical protein VHP83_06695 [Aggregatilineaceae bacterium]|nr:hypothetical protein [Aggregatilineaceae bacterium]